VPGQREGPAGIRPPDDATLGQVETWLRGQRRESAYAFDATGKKVWEKHTAAYEVALTEGDKVLVRGQVFTHNHPRGWDVPEDDPLRPGSSFSLEDVRLATELGLAELRAISPAYRMSMRSGPFGWPSGLMVQQAFAVANEQWRQRYASMVRQGMIDIERANAEQLHEIWQELAPVLGLVYNRERW
jgi:hypothetical protein